jgi:enoyl-CoA hydratase/carnithine racemase
MEIVLSCDLVVAGRSARFGLPEVARGLIPTCGGLFRAQHALPLNVAKELILTGQPLSAERAYSLGLVNDLVDDGGALPAAVALAARIIDNSPTSVSQSLVAIQESADSDDAAGWRATARAIDHVIGSPNSGEGLTAFFERRPPEWSNN